MALFGEMHEGDQDVAKRREQVRIEHAGARRQLPQEQADKYRQIEDRDTQCPHHATGLSSAMVRTTSSRSKSQSSSAFWSIAAREASGPSPVSMMVLIRPGRADITTTRCDR